MPALDDRDMERLSGRLAQGTLNNAQEIAKLLKPELRETQDRFANLNRYCERIFQKLLPLLTSRYS